MPSDRWIRVPTKWKDEPHVCALSDAAFRLHIEAQCYAMEMGTDGYIPPRSLPSMNGATEELCEAGLWAKLEPGWEIVGYLEQQKSAAHLEEMSRQRKAAAHARWNANRMRDAERDAEQPALQTADQSPPEMQTALQPALQTACDLQCKDDADLRLKTKDDRDQTLDDPPSLARAREDDEFDENWLPKVRDQDQREKLETILSWVPPSKRTDHHCLTEASELAADWDHDDIARGLAAARQDGKRFLFPREMQEYIDAESRRFWERKNAQT